MLNATADSVITDQQACFQRGYVQVYTGDGKGKTTAAIGLAVRALGAGLSVYVAQFMKTGQSSEIKYLAQLTNRIKIENFMGPHEDSGGNRNEAWQKSLKWSEQVIKIFHSKKYNIVILEEINMAIMCGLLPIKALLDLISAKPDPVEMVITGRYAHPELLARADLVTDMKEVKHYYRAGVAARMGIEE